MKAPLSSVLRRAGRLLLWLALILLLVRGGIALVSPAAQVVAPAPSDRPEPAFPDDEARAFALGFARAYLTFAPRGEADHAQALAPYLAPGLDEHAGLVLPEKGDPQGVVDATVARVHLLADETALLTLAVGLKPSTRTLYLAVPVARDPLGQLAVVELPALAAPPARSLIAVRESGETLRAGERAGIEALLRRFFPAYLAGSRGELAYFLPAGVRIDPVGGPWSEVALVDVSALARPQPGALVALATVRARDEATGALLSLRYRVSLLREGRWYVAAVNDDRKGRP